METIKCKECGQVMGAASEACPRCGTPVINETDIAEMVEQTENQIPSIEETRNEEETLGNDNTPCYHIPSNNLSKVIRMIEKYNKKAEEWGYETLAYNEQTMTFTGSFTEKNEANGFWAESKEVYRNGYLKEDFEKIVKLCTA